MMSSLPFYLHLSSYVTQNDDLTISKTFPELIYETAID